MASSDPESMDISTPDAILLYIDAINKETQHAYQWDNKQLEIIEAHYKYHNEMCIALDLYKKHGPKGIEWPKKPKGEINNSQSKGNVNKPQSLKGDLSAREFHNYLIKNIIYFEPASWPTFEECNATGLDQILCHLKSGYNVLKNQNAITLNHSIEYGKWLEKAFELHCLDKLAGRISGTWEDWLEKNIGIAKSYAGKLRNIAKLLKDYPLFRRLGLSFSEVYSHRRQIKDMLESCKDIADIWKQRDKESSHCRETKEIPWAIPTFITDIKEVHLKVDPDTKDMRKMAFIEKKAEDGMNLKGDASNYTIKPEPLSTTVESKED